MILELLCSAAISQISSGTEIVYKDLGRLTPYGRTVDVYIKNTHGDVPIKLGSNGPGTFYGGLTDQFGRTTTTMTWTSY